ncbi:PRC-barrel domain-containing protein [Nevskia soli]|uniref:PRC-barrel domain-containing protein n=1 Tax=Nevskia soli TaxID=418856 RepID=UPI001B809ED0|nr:PRC-barrel domain-containing protein [Nevskia soli]
MMLYRMEKLIGLSIGATDGEIGKVKDVYFDDRRWAARYLVVDAGGWLEDRKVLISPIAITGIDWDKRTVQVRLTRAQVKGSPPIDSDKPVSRQYEMEYFGYYGYPDYLGGSLLWGAMPVPVMPPAIVSPAEEALVESPENHNDQHLHSAAEVIGYHLHATDDAIGHLQDFLLDCESWAIRYIVVDTRNWLPGKQVVIPPHWIKRLEWPEKIVEVDVTRETVKGAPEYDPKMEFSRVQEEVLYRHYKRPGYWE